MADHSSLFCQKNNFFTSLDWKPTLGQIKKASSVPTSFKEFELFVIFQKGQQKELCFNELFSKMTPTPDTGGTL